MPIVERPRAVVTGAASGLGRAFAKHFAELGGSVLIADIDEAGANETKSIVEGLGARAFVTRCDVSKPEEVEALVGEAERTIGGADVVVNNAGVAVSGLVGDIPLAELTAVVLDSPDLLDEPDPARDLARLLGVERLAAVSRARLDEAITRARQHVANTEPTG